MYYLKGVEHNTTAKTEKMDLFHLFRSQLTFVVSVIVLCVLATLVDLAFGVFKAKMRGEQIVSERLRDTVVKLVLYVCLLVLTAFVDYLQVNTLNEYNQQMAWSVPLFPIITAIGGLIILAIEIKSMFEHADKKTRKHYESVINTMLNLAKTRKDAEQLLEVMAQAIQKDKLDNEEHN